MSISRHKEGSFRELWTVSLPLMMASFSMTLMFFVDRLLLAKYSIDAHNAAVSATTFGWALVFFGVCLAGIAEVFVAQNNGAKRFKKMGSPVWQMVWLALLSVALYTPVAFFGTDLIYPKAESFMERDYFRVMILFAPAQVLFGALAGFWVGRGKATLITVVSCIGNGVNIVLDYILIFGVEGVVPSMGVKGAAIATSAGAIFQAIILFILFIRKNNREEFGTGDYSYNPPLFKKSLVVGFPVAIAFFFEVLGWGVFYKMMGWMGKDYVTVAGISQSLVILFWFVIEGVQKGAMACCGNHIGAKQPDFVWRVLWQGTKMLMIMSAILVSILLAAPNFLPSFFIEAEVLAKQPDLAHAIHFGIFCYFLYFFFEGFRLLVGAVLTSAGDTKFHMVAGSLGVWVLLIIPLYVMITKVGVTIYVAMGFSVFYSVAISLLYLWRFRTEKWRGFDLLSTEGT